MAYFGGIFLLIWVVGEVAFNVASREFPEMKAEVVVVALLRLPRTCKHGSRHVV